MKSSLFRNCVLGGTAVVALTLSAYLILPGRHGLQGQGRLQGTEAGTVQSTGAIGFQNRIPPPLALPLPVSTARGIASLGVGVPSPANPALQNQAPPVTPQSVQSLSRMMSELMLGMKSVASANVALKKYRECLENPKDESFAGVQAICARNARLLGEKYPELKKQAGEIAALGSKNVDQPVTAPGGT